MLLAYQHGIEQNLYYGDSLPKIYQQLGDARLTRFLSRIANEEPTPKKTLEKLLTFLEKEEKLNRQKILIHGHQGEKTESTNNSAHQHHRSTRGQPPKLYLNHPATNEPASCHLCGDSSSSTEHVSSNGPGGTRIVQYYTCKNFAEKNPVKKHVLVCEEHRDHQDNQEVLAKFKSCCLRSFNLPDFAKQIQLSFHSNCSSHSSIPSPKDSIADKGVYLLQTIVVNGNKLNVFYDNGCSDVSQQKLSRCSDRWQVDSTANPFI